MKDNQFHIQYLDQAVKLQHAGLFHEDTIAWQSPSNIALVKYWGKYGNQLPGNPSVSFTLARSVTRTEMAYRPGAKNDRSLEFFFDNRPDPAFEERLIRYREQLLPYLPFLNEIQVSIHSNNTFPHSAGIASSASSFSALALCFTSLEDRLFGSFKNNSEFIQKASFLARLGSGSACRSVYGRCSLWGHTPYVENSSDEIAVSLNTSVHPTFSAYHDAILIIDTSPKEVSSTEGHKMMEDHPYKTGRKTQASVNLEKLMIALHSGDLADFVSVVENEAMSLHGLMWSAGRDRMLLKPNTLEVIRRIRDFRCQTGIPCAFTMDAGPNVHLLFPHDAYGDMVGFIADELQSLCEKGIWIDDSLSDGPVCLNG